MTEQKLLSNVRKAINDYSMIASGDKIAIGISGGKDSLTLAYALSKLKTFYPVPFELCAITIDLGFEGFNTTDLDIFMKELNIPYYVEKTEIGSIIFEHRKEKHPCSLCSRMRKAAFNEVALREGCTKIAYAHHKDDVIDTFLMSLMYEGRLHTFSPVTNYDKNELTLIRPLIYTYEGEITTFSTEHNFPICKNPCPADKHTKREESKSLLKDIQKTVPDAKTRILSAIEGANLDGWHRQ